MTQSKRKPTKARTGTTTKPRTAKPLATSKAAATAKPKAARPARPTKRVATKRIGMAKNAAVEAVTDTASVVGSRARRAAVATADFVTANAVPLTLLGIGTGLMAYTVLRRRRQAQNDVAQNDSAPNTTRSGAAFPSSTEADTQELLARGREKLAELAERAAEGAQHVRERVQESATRLGDRAVELGHDAADGLAVAEQRARDFAGEHPLATTAAAVATGVGIGMAIPTSQIESKVLGPARAKIAEEASTLFNEVKSGVQSAIEAAAEVKNDLVARASR